MSDPHGVTVTLSGASKLKSSYFAAAPLSAAGLRVLGLAQDATGKLAEAEETLDEDESEQESLISDAEWEGWRRELELEAPIRPDSPALKFAQEGNPWTSESTQPSFVTESDGLRRGRRRKNTLGP